LLLDGKALERANDLAVQDIHRLISFHSSLWIIYLDLSAAVVDTAVVAQSMNNDDNDDNGE
jgi:hypothetical protein